MLSQLTKYLVSECIAAPSALAVLLAAPIALFRAALYFSNIMPLLVLLSAVSPAPVVSHTGIHTFPDQSTPNDLCLHILRVKSMMIEIELDFNMDRTNFNGWRWNVITQEKISCNIQSMGLAFA
ncbi:hypothetical protein T05_2522 [Trichinella murrelli]|uniref:Uncharacterized protein n=1 Tax=Trichinella murrelli TaxID=144512 RepID=A0A0V0TP54_9BILA|nr:hypothetical protein T05_2522 [Trichinella murrelli]